MKWDIWTAIIVIGVSWATIGLIALAVKFILDGRIPNARTVSIIGATLTPGYLTQVQADHNERFPYDPV